MKDEVRILTIDIETIPATGYFFELFNQNISLPQVTSPSRVGCFAAKWYGQKGIEFYSEHHDGRKKMIKEAHRLLSEADIVVHYNGVSFDIPHLNREFWLNGMSPPIPFKNVDLYRTVRRQFNFLSNKLAFVSEQAGIGEKVANEGMPLWIKCDAGDPSAWKKMRQYNIGDVRLTEQLYEKLLLTGWIVNHPNVATIANRPKACPHCKSEKGMISRGPDNRGVTRRLRFQCKNCHSYVSGRKIERLETNYVVA